MQTNVPREALDLIRAMAHSFALDDAADPRSNVDIIMADLETVLARCGNNSSSYLDRVINETKLSLSKAETASADVPLGDRDPYAQRRVRFLRSMAQMLDARRSVTTLPVIGSTGGAGRQDARRR